MPKKTSTSTSIKSEQVAVSAPVVSIAVSESKPKSSKSKTVDVVLEQVVAPSVAPSVAQVVVQDSAADVIDTDADLTKQSAEFSSKIQQLCVLLSSVKTDYRALEKKWMRLVKNAQKVSSKRKRKAGNRAPSGFVKPTKISDELASFLGKEKGSEMARTEVTRDINKYIRTNNLQDKENGRKIIPDSKLATLLKLNQSDELTYFNLQKYMSPHFAKANKEAAANLVSSVTSNVVV
jgi:upstream activation factor subunit UAF30